MKAPGEIDPARRGVKMHEIPLLPCVYNTVVLY